MEIRREILIDSSSEKIWNVIGNRFGDVQDWLSVVKSSKVSNTNKLLEGALCSGRICITNFGKVTETITHFNEKEKILSYDAKAEKMPFFVKGLENTWKIISIEDGKSKASVTFKMKVVFPFNLFVNFMMKPQMDKTMRLSLEELKYFVENDKPHQRNMAHES